MKNRDVGRSVKVPMNRGDGRNRFSGKQGEAPKGLFGFLKPGTGQLWNEIQGGQWGTPSSPGQEFVRGGMQPWREAAVPFYNQGGGYQLPRQAENYLYGAGPGSLGRQNAEDEVRRRLRAAGYDPGTFGL